MRRRSFVLASLAAPLAGTAVWPASTVSAATFQFRVTQPTESNVGIDAGVTLTDYTGPTTITTAGTVIRAKRIKSSLSIRAANVLIENCELWGNNDTTYQALVDARHVACKNLTVRKCESRVRAPGSPSSNGVIGHDFLLELSIIEDVIDAVGVYNTTVGSAAVASNVVVRGNLLRSLMYVTPYPSQSDNQSHNDCIQVQACSGTQIYGNSFQAFGSRRVGNIDSNPRGARNQQVLSCVILTPVANAGGPVNNTSIEDNWFSGGYVPININEKGRGNITGLRITGNRHRRDMYFGPAGNGQSTPVYGLLPAFNLAAGNSVLTGNVNDLGAPVTYAKGS